METDEDSRSSSNSTGTSNSTSNGPASPPQEQENESNDQPQILAVQHQSRASSPESNSFQEQPELFSPAAEENVSNQNLPKEEEELELSDVDDESSKPNKADINHEDLSDISDLESNSPSPNFTDLRQKLESKRLNGSSKDNDEDELDFEDDEVRDVSENAKRAPPKEEKAPKEDGEHKSEQGSIESGEELEDGEVTDGDDKRPEESEPKAVCRFFTRGQCTWGMSCRFLHPGTTDKGNYTMFDMVRPIPVPQAVPIIPPYDYRIERPPIHHLPYGGHPRIAPIAESETAWERGLRTAKEMMRKANKRKEQDTDFDEKKMNLSGPPDEIEKDPYYVRGSPEPVPIVSIKTTPPFERIPRERPRYDYSPPPKYARGAPAPFEEDLYGRAPRFRELPSHRMPHYEDDDLNKRRPVRPTREVIVEKADEWSDPWARKVSRRDSAGRENRNRGRERSYSSNSSYSSSSASSRSHSSSESSGTTRHKRFESHRIKELRRPIRPKSPSPSLKRRHSPPARARLLEKKAVSPVVNLKRKKPITPPVARPERAHGKKKRDSSSGSGSSSGSESGSESYSSSTSDSKGKKKREKIVVERKPSSKTEVRKKRPTPTKDDKKEKASLEKAAAAAKMKSTRREELLKQLKAVEDAIARKKSKIN